MDIPPNDPYSPYTPEEYKRGYWYTEELSPPPPPLISTIKRASQPVEQEYNETLTDIINKNNPPPPPPHNKKPIIIPIIAIGIFIAGGFAFIFLSLNYFFGSSPSTGNQVGLGIKNTPVYSNTLQVSLTTTTIIQTPGSTPVPENIPLPGQTPSSTPPPGKTPTVIATVAPTATPAGINNVTVTGMVLPGATGYFVEENLNINNPSTITAFTATITVKKTTGILYSGMYTTINYSLSGMTLTHTDTETTIVYTYTLNPGQTITSNPKITLATQMSGTGTIHPTANDTYTIVSTVNGTTKTLSGHF
jgi:hypothetical protein